MRSEETSLRVFERLCAEYGIPLPDEILLVKNPDLVCLGGSACIMHDENVERPRYAVILPIEYKPESIAHEFLHYLGHIRNYEWKHNEKEIEKRAKELVKKYHLERPEIEHEEPKCPECLRALKERLCALGVPEKECDKLLDDFFYGKISAEEVVKAFRDRWKIPREEFEADLFG